MEQDEVLIMLILAVYFSFKLGPIQRQLDKLYETMVRKNSNE